MSKNGCLAHGLALCVGNGKLCETEHLQNIVEQSWLDENLQVEYKPVS